MCYLKNLRNYENVDMEDLSNDGVSDTMEVLFDKNVLTPCINKCIRPIWSQDEKMLICLFGLIDRNNMLILQINKAIDRQSIPVIENFNQIENKLQKREVNSLNLLESKRGSCNMNLNLISRLFGSNKYNYSLVATKKFPTFLYKERNFDLSLKLVDNQGKTVENVNIINLCCTVASCSAEWIHQNRVGESILKGRTEVQLYKGEANFTKMYAREVSRIYHEGKVNLIIYSKPTTLVYSGLKCYERIINSAQIRPLAIEKIIIKAKRSKNQDQ